ncbi:MAG: 4-hydroxy-3-methylbut-2-enyl diphosphate reductase [Candidatus Aminicenantes bacterium]|nr:4-hydroxy-3-methylbut-2-enyl diphosphate reductase [Candidatus Aminicenantes bacterium]
MRITLSGNLSYCFGVRKTLTLVEDLLARNPDRTYYMYGEIVHNELVIRGLRAKGLSIIRDLTQIGPTGSVIIPSHGAPLGVFEDLQARGVDVIDATCPMVRLIHEKARRLEADGFTVVIIGDPRHDEVRGIAGHVDRALVFRHPADVTAASLAGVGRAGIVVQSTFIREEARAVLEAVRALVPEVLFEDTICRPTSERQEEVRRMAARHDCVLIVGSRRSANTRHLYDLAGGEKACVHFVDDPEQVAELPIPSGASVFVASGASTPMSAVERVVELLERRKTPAPSSETHA